MTQAALDLDGFDAGPLFAPPARRVRGSGGKEIWAKWKRARPAWANLKAIDAFWNASRRMTAETGIQHSVDHIVPLINPLVCGLHVEHNLEVTTLLANLHKSNSWWPDMWSPQLEIFE